jgi:hypothetical protein
LLNWRGLSPARLADRVRMIQRAAIERHLPEGTWRTLDLMRAQLRFYQHTNP